MAVRLGIETYQTLTNNVDVYIPSLSSILLAVQLVQKTTCFLIDRKLNMVLNQIISEDCTFMKTLEFYIGKMLQSVRSLRLELHILYTHFTFVFLNNHYAADSCLVYIFKMEYAYKINIFDLKMMMKSGLEKIFLKFLQAQILFQTN